MARLRDDWQNVYSKADSVLSDKLFSIRGTRSDAEQLILKYLVSAEGNAYTADDWKDKSFNQLKGVWGDNIPDADWGKSKDQIELEQFKREKREDYDSLSVEQQQEYDRLNESKANDFSNYWREELAKKGIEPGSLESGFFGKLQKLNIIKASAIKKGQFILDGEKYAYFSGRAISAGEVYGANDNGDWFSREELRKAAPTFIGVGIHCNHNSDDSRTAIGFILDSTYVNDSDFIEVIFALDKNLAEKAFPGLLQAVLNGKILDLSMGCFCERSYCNICSNLSYTPIDYCNHIRLYKGLEFEGKKVYEINEGVSFFELSLIFDPLALQSGINEGFGADRDAKILQKIANKKEEIMSHNVKANADGNPTDSMSEAKDYELSKEVDKATSDQAKKVSDTDKDLGNPTETMEKPKDYPLAAPIKISSRAWLQLSAKERKALGDALIVPDQDLDVVQQEETVAIEDSDKKKDLDRKNKAKDRVPIDVKESTKLKEPITKKILDVIGQLRQAVGVSGSSVELTQESLPLLRESAALINDKLVKARKQYVAAKDSEASVLSVKSKKKYAEERESLAEQIDSLVLDAEDIAARIDDVQAELGGEITEAEGVVQPAELAEKITGKVTGPGGHIPDGTGPYGRGQGPGKGKADGSGLESLNRLDSRRLLRAYFSHRAALRQDKKLSQIQKTAILKKVLALGNPSSMLDAGDYQLANDVIKKTKELLTDSNVESREDIKRQRDTGFSTAEERSNMLKKEKGSLRSRVKARLAVRAMLRKRLASKKQAQSDMPTTPKPLDDPGAGMKWVYDPTTGSWSTVPVTPVSARVKAIKQRLKQRAQDKAISLGDAGIEPTEAKPDVVKEKVDQIDDQIVAIEQVIDEAKKDGEDIELLTDAKETLEDVQFTLDKVDEVKAALRKSKLALLRHRLAKKSSQKVLRRPLGGSQRSATSLSKVASLTRENILLRRALKQDKVEKLVNQMIVKGMLQSSQRASKVREVMGYSDETFTVTAQLVQDTFVDANKPVLARQVRHSNQRIPQGLASERSAALKSSQRDDLELGEDFFS